MFLQLVRLVCLQELHLQIVLNLSRIYAFYSEGTISETSVPLVNNYNIFPRVPIIKYFPKVKTPIFLITRTNRIIQASLLLYLTLEQEILHRSYSHGGLPRPSTAPGLGLPWILQTCG